jgi:menaquinone-dependent protoporphyrinogen oxidase
MRILIAYATVHGSTRSIAENLGRFLAAYYLVTTRPVAEVDSLADYDAVVLGSAVHDGAWLPEAQAFLVDHAADLWEHKLWLFSVGMADALPRPVRRMAARAEAKQLSKGLPADVRPRGVRLFSGVIRREHLTTRSARVRMRLIGARYGDFRSWPQVKAWANEIASDLQPPAMRYPTTSTSTNQVAGPPA